MTAGTRFCFSQFLTVLLLAITLAALGHPSHAQVASDDLITNGNWWRNCASLDLDFYNDRYYINSNTSCDGTVGTVYSGATYGTNITNFITGTGSTFTRAGTNVTATGTPFYLSSIQTFVSRASVTNNVTSTFAPFYISITGNGPSQSWVSRADGGTAVATYYNSSGNITTATAGTARSSAYTYNGSSWVLAGTLIEPTATNVVHYSSLFSNAYWAKGGTTIVANAGTAPDGTNTAQQIVEGTTTGVHTTYSPNNTVNNGTFTWSVYAKAGARTWLFMNTAGAGISTYFDLVNGVVGTTANTTSTSITSVGNGWFRCTMTASTSVTAGLEVDPATSNGGASYTGDGASGIYVWGGQVEANPYATSYIATTTAAVTRAADVYNQQPASYFDSTGTLYFTPANTARTNYTYSGSWTNAGTLIEPSSTNSIRNNMMAGAAAADGIERTYLGTFSGCSGSDTSSSDGWTCGTNTQTPASITSITDSSGTATVLTSSAHNLAVGYIVTISGASPSNYNGSFMVTSIPSSTQFTYTMISDPMANATTVGSYTATQFGWAGTVNGGSGTVTGTSGSITLTGDGTNAASIYQKITTVSGYNYYIKVINSTGNAVTVQAGTAIGGATLLAASTAPVSTTSYYEFTATGTATYIQINNTSTTAAKITTVSFQRAGTFPTDWSAVTGNGIAATVIGTGTEEGISYVDVKFVGTTNAASSLGMNFETTTAIAAAQSQTWTESGYFKLTTGSWGTTTQAPGWSISELNSSGTVLVTGQSSFSSLPTGSNLDTQHYTYSYPTTNASTAYLRPYFSVQYASGVSVNFTIRIGMPQIEHNSYGTSPIPTFGSAVTRTADVYNQAVGTYFNASGILTTAAANTPRMDHNPVSPYNPVGLLIEESRTNLASYSTPYTGWSVAGSTNHTTTAPDNTLTYSYPQTGGGHNGAFIIPTVSSSTTYTYSVFVKNVSGSGVALLGSDTACWGSGASATVTFNPSTGAFSGVTSGVTSYDALQLSNGWWRVSLTMTSTSSCTQASDINYVIATGASVEIAFWGDQIEQAAFVTSFIPTTGATVTRQADNFSIPVVASGTNGAWSSSSPQTFTGLSTEYLPATPANNILSTGGNAETFELLGTGGNYYSYGTGPSTGGSRYVYNIYYNGNHSCGRTAVPLSTYTNKFGISITSGSALFDINGGAFDICAITTLPASLTNLWLGSNGGVNSYVDQYLQRFTYMPTAMPSAALVQHSQ